MYERFAFPADSGTQDIQGQMWLPEQSPRALVQVVHGVNEYGGRYADFAAFLNRQGIALAVHDHMGHGLTAEQGGRLGYFAPQDGWRHCVADVRACTNLLLTRFPHTPLFIFGHSMGSFMLRCLLADYPVPYQGAIISGTVHFSQLLYASAAVVCAAERLRCGREGKSRLVRTVGIGKCTRAFANEGHPAAWLSRDAAVYRAYGHDPYCRFLPTVETYRQMFLGMSYMDKASTWRRMPPQLPLLLLGGSEDPAGNNGRAVAFLYEKWSALGFNVEKLLYPGARHETLNELNKDEVYADLLAWLERQLDNK